MTDAESEMLNTTFSTMKQILSALHSRLEALEKDNTVAANTIHNLPMILENMNDRAQRLEDKFDQLTHGQVDWNSDEVRTNLFELVEEYLTDNNYQDESDVEAKLEDLEFITEDDVRDVVRRVVRNDVTVSLDC